jgi:ribosomal protein S18 acetylase RimI-like enzyme
MDLSASPIQWPRLSFGRFDKRFLDASWGWLQDPELKHLTMTPEFTREQQLSWFHALPRALDYFIWGITYLEKPIGAVGLKNVSGPSAEFWCYIGERGCWGLGLGREIVAFAEGEARAMGLSELWLQVRPDNVRAVRLYEKAGFAVVRTIGDILRMQKRLSPST